MANPQKEDGYTEIANEILDAIAFVNLSPYEWRCLIFLWRKTYGWNKKKDVISVSQWQKGTGLDRRHIGRTLKRLLTRNIIGVNGKSPDKAWFFQKDYEKWDEVVSPVEATPLSPVEAIPDLPPKPKEATPLSPVEATTKTQYKDTHSLQKSGIFFGTFLQEIFNHWNAQKIVVHKKLTDSIKKTIKTNLKDYPAEDIKTAISNYALILNGPDYYFKHKWTLRDFLNRGLDKFLDLETAKSNYAIDKWGMKSGQKKPYEEDFSDTKALLAKQE